MEATLAPGTDSSGVAIVEGLAGELAARIEARSARIGILGLGYVGLPLALRIAERGFDVTGFDPDTEKVASLAQGKSYVEDVRDEAVAEARGRFRGTTDFSGLTQCDVVVVCVPTPLSKTKDPDLRYLEAAAQAIKEHLRRGQLISIESTTYPGTTEEVVLPALQATGLKVEEDFFLAFSPERVDPTNQVWTVRNTPKVVGGHGPASGALAKAFYGSFVDTVVPVSSTKSAEMVKILENTFRAVNIGLINEIAIMCNKLGIDVWEVIEAAKTKPFGFMPFYPGPGLGGHCIPVDPLYLGWKLRSLNYRARFVELADHVNSTQPNYVVFRIAAVLNAESKCVKGSRILALGAAYKPGVSDVRESPALTVIESLRGLGAEISYHDPHAPSVVLGLHGGHQGPTLQSVPLVPETVAKQDLVVLLTAHKEIDYAMVEKHARRIFDTRNAFAKAANVVKL